MLGFGFSARERRKSFAKQQQIVPKFPKVPDSLVRTENLEERRVRLLLEYGMNIVGNLSPVRH